MALLTDGTISSIEDLSGHDSQLLTVANSESINVTQKLLLAKDEILLEISGLLARMTGWGSSGWMGQTAWPMTADSTRTVRHVVVTIPVKLWHTFRTLELFYQDAYNSQLNDRYGGKRDEYKERARWAYEKVVATGLGMVWKPIPQAAAPTLQSVTGTTANGTYYVAVSWINAVGEEGAPSVPSQITVAGSSFQVTPGAAPEIATGWNVYAGSDPKVLSAQNGSPLPTGTSFLFPASLTTTGQAMECGQKPNYLQPVPRVIQRG
jgi:hypothetical protein